MKSVSCLVFQFLFCFYTVNCARSSDAVINSMFEAAEKNDFAALKKILDSNKNILSQNKDHGISLLEIAVMQENLEMIRYLVTDQHVDINKPDDLGSTILFRAAEEGLFKSLKLLLELGADKNRVTLLDGSTLLHQAAKGGNVEILRFLLPYFNVDVRSSFRATPAFFAAKEGKLEALHFLLENRADPSAKDKDGSTLMHAAVESNQVDVIKELIRFKHLINTPDENGNLPIDIISNMEVVKELVNAGSNIRDNTIWNYYNIGDIDTVDYLVIKSGKVNLRLTNSSDKCGDTLLMSLLSKDTPPYDKIKLLLEKGADVNMKYCENITALHRAAFYGGENYQKILKLLLDHKADINARDSRGRTPLDVGNEKVAAYLRKFGGVSGIH